MNTLAALDGKKPEFDAVPLSNLLVDGDIRSLKNKFLTLDLCFINAMSEKEKPVAQSYVDKINAAFDTSYSVWGLH